MGHVRLPTLYVKPPSWARGNGKYGPVAPTHEQDWARFTAKVAKAYARSHPDRTRNVYQITWEPDRNWDNWDGDDASLVRLHELAYKAIHEADSRAEVIGPAISPMWAIAGDYGRYGSEARGFLSAGGAPFVDGFAVHPYFDEATGARKHAWLGITRLNWPSQYRARMNKFLTMWYLAKGTHARFYGTEVGLVLLNEENSSGPDLLHQARFDVIQFLEFLGLGAELNFGFYDVDWDIGKNTFEKGQHRGYYYNLDKVGWGSRIMSPKPVAPAYAACSWFLEGHTSRGPIAGLLGESYGYVFQRGADTVLAAWDSAATHEVALDVSPIKTPTVVIYDWMGNRIQSKAVADGRAKVMLGPSPIYIKSGTDTPATVPLR